MFEGKYWPNEEDRMPRQAIYYISGSIQAYPVNESGDVVEARIRKEYPLYRIVTFGTEILQKISGGEKYEV